MIVLEVRNLKHNGCCLSDISSEFPSLDFKICLTNINAVEYSVLYLIKEDEKVSKLKTIKPLITSITDHQMCKENILVGEGHIPLYKLTLDDTSFTRAMIRAVIDEKDARFPPYQCMEVKAGVETFYTVINTPKVNQKIQNTLSSTLGQKQMNYKILSSDAKKEQVFDIIPSIFTELLPRELSNLFIQIMKNVVSAKTPKKEIWEIINEKMATAKSYLSALQIALDLIKFFGGLKI